MAREIRPCNVCGANFSATREGILSCLHAAKGPR